MSLIKTAIKQLVDRKLKVEKGGINSIPSPFNRFKSSFIGIEQGAYYIVTGQTKSAKTQLASFLFLYTPILYSYYNKIPLKIFYYPFEETKDRIVHRFISYLLYTLHNIEISPRDLRSTSNIAVSQDIIDLIASDTIQDILKYFEESVVFSEERNPTGIYKELSNYFKDNGSISYTEVPVKGDFGELKMVKKFDRYIPNDENTYVLAIIDHISLISNERGFSKKESIDKLSEYLVILRNNFNLSPVVIQQQAAMNTENYKLDLLRPTREGLADSKYPGLDCQYMIGIFSPYAFKLPEYQGYNCSILKDEFRMIELILSRDGVSNSMVGLKFKGASAYFEELPPPNTPELSKVYLNIKENKDKNKEQNKPKITLLTLFKRLLK